MTEQETIKKIQEAVPGRKEVNKKLIDNNCQPLPETLEDCLIAIPSERFKFDDFYFTDSNDYSVKWKPNTPFHEQSDETKDFIGNLLT